MKQGKSKFTKAVEPYQHSANIVSTDLKEQFENVVKHYLTSNPIIKNNNQLAELEIRFNATHKYANYITKIDYDNVIKQIYHLGFDTSNKNGIHMLRISNEHTDVKTGYTKISNIRAELAGLDLIQEYCKTNSIQKILDLPSSANLDKIKFTRKTPAFTPSSTRISPVDFKDFGFRVSYQMEEDFIPSYGIAREIVSKWSDTKKIFRFLNRVRFSHPTYPVVVDVSIVKSSKKTNRVPIPTYTLEESGVMTSEETYEIELEVDNSKVGVGTAYNTADKLLSVLRKMVRHVMCAFQKTAYPISFSEKEEVQQTYLKLIHETPHYSFRRIFPKDFIGPSSYTLQLSNISEPEGNATHPITPNIRTHMTVTDKADGERRLLFISPNRRIYMIDTNMNVIFTGYMIALNKRTAKMANSLIDGEFIKYDKNGNVINVFAGFDIYFMDGKSVRDLAFVKEEEEEDDEEKKEGDPANNLPPPPPRPQSQQKTRLQWLHLFISNISLVSCESAETNPIVPVLLENIGGVAPVVIPTACNFRIQCKTFYATNKHTTIFQGCNEIITKMKDGLFEYNTDGIIFTPSRLAVGSSKEGVAGPLHKITWENSFKWKPPEFNTIDFLVAVKKDKKGNHEIHNILQEGATIQQYKSLLLMCGFDINKHSNINPYMEIINDRIPTPTDVDNNETYIPIPFQPSDPFDSNAYMCNVMLQDVTGGGNRGETGMTTDKTWVMRTEEGEYFEEDTIVEFRYDLTKKNQWRWIPLRVRHDKTSELRAGIKNYGNAFHVANSNWSSIHNPITEEMITTGEGIPSTISSIVEDDVYYNNQPNNTTTEPSPSLTRSMRDFHNLYVKMKLIESVAEREHILIDYACGKGGDIPKWIQSKLAFVFGVDISRDNIHNRLNGACSRYINFKKKFKDCPSALFVQGNSASNIRTNEQAFYTEKDKEITRAVFGKGPKDEFLLGKGVYKNYGVAKDGFHISSVQFALHYFFENKISLNQFCRNLTECTKLGGYFIGTCYDGETVFERLKRIEMDEQYTLYKNKTVILNITKKYAQTGFPPNENSLGYAIDVFQESINKTIREYLMNYKYLVQILENYGFVEMTTEEARKNGLPNHTGLFGELYQQLQNEVQMNPRKNHDYKDSSNMTPDEMQLSFMNRFFVFKKVRNVDAEKMSKLLVNSNYEEMQLEEQEQPEQQQSKKINKTRKLNVRKIVIDNYEPIETNTPYNSIVPEIRSEQIKPSNSQTKKMKSALKQTDTTKTKKKKLVFV
jgi:hypothetical protein